MKRIYYLSITSFTDVDFGVIDAINQRLLVRYGVFVQKINANYSDKEILSACVDRNIDFKIFKLKHSLKNIRSLFLFIRVIYDVLKFKPDIVYIVSFDHLILTLLFFFLNPKKTIVAIHDVEFHSDTKYESLLKVSRWLLIKHFDYFHVFSDFQHKIFKEKYPSKKSFKIDLPLKNFDVLSPIDRNFCGDYNHGKKINFLFFGNILPYKGLDILIEAFNAINRDSSLNSKYTLVIAGRCNNWDYYRKKILFNNSLIELIRFIDNNEISDLFLNSHYLVLPYKDATQSGPLKIAFNYNVPVIASNLESFSNEIFDGSNGYLFKAGDVEDLQRVLKACIDSHESRYFALKMSLNDYVKAKYSGNRLSDSFFSMLAYFQIKL